MQIQIISIAANALEKEGSDYTRRPSPPDVCRQRALEIVMPQRSNVRVNISQTTKSRIRLTIKLIS